MKDYYNNISNENKACMKRSKLGDIYKITDYRERN